jgi:hypothetical protein
MTHLLRSLNGVDHQLEARRLAIVEALREVMTEPADPPAPALVETAPAPVVPHMSAPVPLTLVRSPEPEHFEPELEPIDDQPEPIEADAGTPAIPPLERAGQMSPAAARALFGHH